MAMNKRGGGRVGTSKYRMHLVHHRCFTVVRRVRDCGRRSSLYLGPSPSHLCWLAQGPLGPGHSLGKGYRTHQGVEFLDLANGHSVFFYFIFFRSKGLWNRSNNMASCFPNGIWAGGGGVGPFSPIPSSVNQGQGSHCGGVEHCSQVGGWETRLRGQDGLGSKEQQIFLTSLE